MDALTFLSLLVLALVVWRLSRRARKAEAQRNALTVRVYALEQKLRSASAPQAVETPTWRKSAEPSSPPPDKVPPAPAGVPAAELKAAQPESPGQPPAPAVTLPAEPEHVSIPQSAEHQGWSLPRPAWGLPSLEEALGGNLFTKLGVILIVIGVTFWVATGWHRFSPGLKIAIGYSVSTLLLVPGILFEKRERWRMLARAGIGGGWALTFFVTYAMCHIAGSRVMGSEVLNLLLLLIVVAAMVGHTLKYRSQVVTGLAFLLGFTTVTVSHGTGYCLVASAILAVGLVLIVQRMRWYQLEVFGILATFLNHWYWLTPLIARVGAHHFFPEYQMSMALLVFYWLLFNVSYVIRHTKEAREERVSSVAALLNIGLFLGIMGYQAVYPPHPFAFFLVVGATELALGQLPITRRRRDAFVLLTTVGAVLLATAFPYKYSGSDLSVVWLAEAEAFFLAGVFLREILFRWLGMAAALLVSAQMFSAHVGPVMVQRWLTTSPKPELALAVLFALAAAIFYANAHWVTRRWKSLFTTRFEALCMQSLSYVAAALAVVAAWLAWPGSWTAVAWSALALGLAIRGQRFDIRDFSHQAHLIAAGAVFAALVTNLGSTAKLGPFSLRLVTVAAVVILLYASARWARLSEVADAHWIAQAHTWAATSLALLLAWHELVPVAVAVAWMLMGLVLIEVGLARRSPSLRLQGYVALAASFARIFFVNLTAAGQPGQLSPRLYTIIPLIAAYYYVYWRLREVTADDFSLDRRFHAIDWHCFLGTAALAALARFEFDPAWVAAAWVTIVLVLLAVALLSDQGIFLALGLLLAFIAFLRALTFNLFETSYFGASGAGLRWLSVGAAAALMLACLVFAYRLRAAEAIQRVAEKWTSLWASAYRRPEQLFFFAPAFLVMLLAAVELDGGRITLAWGAEAVAIVLFALLVGERSFRLAGLALLLLCVSKIAFVDVWTLHGNDRALTLTGLGIALVLVSWLYAKHREAVHRYL